MPHPFMHTRAALRTVVTCSRVACALVGLSLGVGSLCAASPLAAQSIMRGEIEGVVREVGGETLGGVSITLTEMGSPATRFLDSDRSGRFAVGLLHTGEYEILAEAPGFIPRLVTGVTLRAGASVRVEVELEPSPPPVETVDTVAVGVSARARFDGLGSRWVTQGEVARLADPRLGIHGLAGLSPALDEALGSEGLPGSSTSIVLDGLPFHVARHPTQRGVADVPLFPRIGLANLDVHRRTDVEWSGGSGGYVATTSRKGAGEAVIELKGSASSGALWQSEGFNDRDPPEATSGWGAGAAHVPLDDLGSAFFVGVEGAYSRTPQLSPLSAELASGLAAVGPGDSNIDASELTDPWLSELRTITGLTRLDWVGETTEFSTRATFGTVEQSGNRFFAMPLRYGSVGPFKGSDVSLSGSVLSEVRPTVVAEGRLALQRSVREWSGPEGADSDPLVPPTRFVHEGVLFGPDPGLAGSVERTTFLATGLLHFEWDGHRLKMGLRGTLSSHAYAYLYDSRGQFLFGTPADVETGSGHLRDAFLGIGAAGQPVPERSFTVPEFGGFLQHRWEPTPQLRLTSGFRFDYETLPQDEVLRDSRWAEVTGAPNELFDTGLTKVSPRVAVEWDPSGGDATLVEVSAAADYGQMDPGALNEVIATPDRVTGRRQIGGLGAWPAYPGGDGDVRRLGRELVTFGPDVRAPRTIRASAGLSQRLGENVLFGISGTFRRTEFLLRRTDLNRTPVSTGFMSEGRPLYGTLHKTGAVVVGEPGSNRRFHEFESIWALNADGTSDYLGLTLALEYAADENLDLFAGYTYSSTEDDLVGARLGVPAGEISPQLGASGTTDWEEGISDFDIPHRLSAGFLSRLPVLQGLELSGVYRFRSGAPFTAGYRQGVDVNGDGSGYNDPAYVPSSLGGIEADMASCLAPDTGGIATRNGCRADGVHALDLHLSLGVFRVGRSVASLTVDVFNLMDRETGAPDSALLLVDPDGALATDPGSDRVEIPLTLNPSFGQVTHSIRPGRLLRVGFSLELP